MRVQLQSARQGETLRDALARVGPPELASFLDKGPGFRVVVGGAPAAVHPTNGSGGNHIAGTDLVASVKLELAPELGAAIQSVALTNEGAEPSPEIDEVDAFYLPLHVRLRDCPRACGFGGGGNDGFYPPQAWREDEVSFGEARTWDPVKTSFTRWWTGKRWFTLGSGQGPGSPDPHFPLVQTGWTIEGGEEGHRGVPGCWNSSRPTGSLRSSNRREVRLSYSTPFAVQTMGSTSHV